MHKKRHTCYRLNFMAVMFLLMFSLDSHAHEYTNLNEIMIDRANDAIASSILQVQSFLSDIFRQRYKPEVWPDPKISILRNDLMHQKEEANMSLDYFVAKGINIQAPDILFDNPLAGRSVAASQGVETAYALLKYVDTLESQQEFVKEIYSNGLSANMYNLITAYREKMDLYKSVFKALPGPAQQAAATLEPPAAAPEIERNRAWPYLTTGVVLGVMVIGFVLGKKRLARKTRPSV